MIHQSILLSTSNCAHGFFEKMNHHGQCQNAAFIAESNFETIRNRRDQIICDIGLPDHSVLSMKQIHSNQVVIATSNWNQEHPPHADGFVTKEKGIVLGILTADCAPLLFLDSQNHVIGACHAGWRGAISGIIENTLLAMTALGAEKNHIRAVLGPTIRSEFYEVGPEFPLLVLNPPYTYSQVFKPSNQPGHHFFDLPTYIRLRLSGFGILRFEDLGLDTYTGSFFSRRRCVAEKQSYDKKANLSTIALL